MSILQMDGLDHYGAGTLSSAGVVQKNFISNGWATPAVRATVLGTAYGKNAGSLGAQLATGLSTDTTAVWLSKPIQPEQYKEVEPYQPVNFVILGFAFRAKANPNGELVLAQVGDHVFAIAPDFTVIGDSTFTQYKIENSIWNYVELEVNARDSKYRIWMNDRLVYDATLTEEIVNFDKWHIKAQYRTGGTANQTFIDVDDIYLMDGKGNVNNTRLGKVNVTTRYPKADVQTEFSRNGGTSNFSRVADASADDDSSHVFSNVIGAVDLYENTDVLEVIDDNAVVAVAVAISARMTEPDSMSIGAVIKSGESEQNGGRMALKASVYTAEKAVFETDPATGTRWKPEAVRTLKWGQKVLERILS